ncbi:uncharacterized protein EV422DRAFT_569905 [Fimicolochytrium jonesii]|uniref:uncharacterized protein n=1 Tax=Fimicolochytrium jonesii TaxID=1396493 RepID=UPI0022FF36E6|nr:uncharacterized protein EV422DRAFT_569905 [Fimicolochytrium jonesii]KAI8818118.1 hypothetical protein EV422DRAFT_569905 [Fimicolochytrium jonesii]
MSSTTSSAPRFTLYHNPSCSKSNATLTFLNSVLSPSTLHIVDYTSTLPALDELTKVCSLMPVGHRKEVVRWDEVDGEGANVSDEDVDAIVRVVMQDVRKRLQRPLVVDWANGKAVVGRPLENVKALIGGEV